MEGHPDFDLHDIVTIILNNFVLVWKSSLICKDIYKSNLIIYRVISFLTLCHGACDMRNEYKASKTL